MSGPIVMVTGHRVLPHPDGIPDELDRVLTKLDASQAVSGGAAGADRLFAESALRVGIPLHLMLPNRWYRSRYPDVVTDKIVAGAAKVTYVVDRPDVERWRYQWDKEKWWKDNYARNEAMVAASEITVVVSDHHPHSLLGYTRSGTAGTVREVLRQRGEGHRVIWVQPAIAGLPPDPQLPATWVPLRVEHALGDWSDFSKQSADS